MDVKHVALAARHKFDGAHFRALSPHELAQIFGVRGAASKTERSAQQKARPLSRGPCSAGRKPSFCAIETYRMRNDALDFHRCHHVEAELSRHSSHDAMRRGREASDVITLHALARSPSVLSGGDDTRAGATCLWEVCQIPDFTKLGYASHAQICEQLFLYLSTAGRIPHGWFAQQIRRLNNVEGDIDALMHRLTAIRLCAYVATKRDWYPRSEPWEKVARG